MAEADLTSFAWAELYLAFATIMKRFKMILYDVKRERDVDHSWGGFAGEPSKETKGIRVRLQTR